MAKKVRKRRQSRDKGKEPNWLVIGGISGIGVIALFALLFVSLSATAGSGAGETTNKFLQNFCRSNPDNCLEEGSDDAPVTLVEVSDYGCPGCRDFNLQKAVALRDEYVTTGQVRWVVMPFTLQNRSGQLPTMPSAESAFCANEQGRFIDYHHAAFELQGTSLFNTEAGFMSLAEELGMDTEAFSSCLAENNYSDIVLRNVQAAQAGGLRVTPTVYVNGRQMDGSFPNISDYEKVINEELAK